MTDKALPSVDVVVPCYNYAHYLEGCIDSLLRQDGVDVRVLIVDDCSKDNSQEVGERLAAADPRVTYKRNEKNLGLVGTANVGLMGWASAKYCVLLSADDALVDGALKRAAAVMDAHPNVGMTYGLSLVFAENDEMTYPEQPARFDYRIISGAAFLERSCRSWVGVASPAAVVRTEMQHKVGGLDPRFTATCDMEIWMRLATVSDVAAIDAVQAYYRRHDANMSAGYTGRPVSDLPEQFGTAKSVIDGYAGHMKDSQSWLDAMRRRLLVESAWLAGMALERGDKEGEKVCTDFARTVSADWWKSPAWLRHRVKHLIGKDIIRVVRKLTGRTGEQAAHQPFRAGELFGWMPEDSVSELHRS
ncbi:MAG: glycosyltransferase family 2 protein [Hyphomonas sp.]|nr:glycosyltransferase family 2 protein [Hyphomonas sp.]